MITRIRIRNFKSLHDVDVELGPFTVLVGPNGAGKSSFLQAIEMLSWLVRSRSINDALEAHGLTYNELVYLRASDSGMHWDVHVEVPPPGGQGKTVRAYVQIILEKKRFVHVSFESVSDGDFPGMPGRNDLLVSREGREWIYAHEGDQNLGYNNVTLPHSILLDVAEQRERFPILGRIAEELRSFIHYEIWGPEALREPSTGAAPRLEEKGSNLPSVLYRLRSSHPDRFKQLCDELRKAYAWLDTIELRSAGERTYALSFLEKAQDKRKRRVRYQASQVSDGFLRLLALTTLKYSGEMLSIVGYEEPENGMHPGMLRQAVACLRDIAANGTQVIVTTHSPFLLQELLSPDSGGDAAKELRLVWRGSDGKTIIRPPKPDLLEKARQQGVGIGELWNMLLDEEQMAEPREARGK